MRGGGGQRGRAGFRSVICNISEQQICPSTRCQFPLPFSQRMGPRIVSAHTGTNVSTHKDICFRTLGQMSLHTRTFVSAHTGANIPAHTRRIVAKITGILVSTHWGICLNILGHCLPTTHCYNFLNKLGHLFHRHWEMCFTHWGICHSILGHLSPQTMLLLYLNTFGHLFEIYWDICLGNTRTFVSTDTQTIVCTHIVAFI